MPTRLVIGTLVACACAAGCNSQRSSGSSDEPQAVPAHVVRATEAPHYFDERDQPLPEWSTVWRKLEAIFGSNTPPRITLRRFSGDGGRFDWQSPTITISDAVEGNRLVQVIAHESCHLSMYQLTRGASADEPFRFFDEGYCDLVGRMIAGENMATYKRSSLTTASREVKTKGVGFATMQHWSDYAGNHPSPKQALAYPTGASFVYFVIDSFGEKKLFDFFRDIGEARDLDTSLRNIFGLTALEVEQRWKDYVASEQ